MTHLSNETIHQNLSKLIKNAVGDRKPEIAFRFEFSSMMRN